MFADQVTTGGLYGIFSGEGSSAGPAFVIIGGILQIDVSTPEALIGTLRGTGKATGVADIQLTARFSAGCPSPCR